MGQWGILKDPEPRMCLECRGGRHLCGRVLCPIIVKSMVNSKRTESYSKELEGSSPPSIFIGRAGYPRVYIGPVAPPYIGDTALMDTPELWHGKSLEEILDFRFSLIRGKIRAYVHWASKDIKLILKLQELAMAKRPVDLEIEFRKQPSGIVYYDEVSPPFGPSAPLKRFEVGGNVKIDEKIEKLYYDRDIRARDAVYNLYKEGVPVSRIYKALSMGVFGRERRIVPTRWSITATDSIISEEIIKRLKDKPLINDYRVYKLKIHKNLFVAILLPEIWSFEWIEAWFPNTTWNTSDNRIEVMGDHEFFKGRTEYPEIGGCYYSARLAVAEALSREGRQAAAIIMREIHSGFSIPIGVWFVRENLRSMFRMAPERFNNLDDALKYAFDQLTLSYKEWLKASTLLHHFLFQTKMDRYLGGFSGLQKHL